MGANVELNEDLNVKLNEELNVDLIRELNGEHDREFIQRAPFAIRLLIIIKRLPISELSAVRRFLRL